MSHKVSHATSRGVARGGAIHRRFIGVCPAGDRPVRELLVNCGHSLHSKPLRILVLLGETLSPTRELRVNVAQPVGAGGHHLGAIAK